MKMIKTLGLTLAAAGLMTISVQAIPINGTLTISGGAVLDSATLGLATSVTSWVTPVVASRSGDFTGFVANGAAVAMTAPWTFSSGPLAALWSVGGFTFNLTASGPATLVPAGPGAIFLLVTGTGTVSGNGFLATAGTFNFSTQKPSASGVFSFSAANGVSGVGVPDGGTTVILLGAALSGLAWVNSRRKQ